MAFLYRRARYQIISLYQINDIIIHLFSLVVTFSLNISDLPDNRVTSILDRIN